MRYCRVLLAGKQIFISKTPVIITMTFPTSAKTIEEAEREFTDEHELLLSRRQDFEQDRYYRGVSASGAINGRDHRDRGSGHWSCWLYRRCSDRGKTLPVQCRIDASQCGGYGGAAPISGIPKCGSDFRKDNGTRLSRMRRRGCNPVGQGLSQLDYMLGLGGQGSTQSTQPGLVALSVWRSCPSAKQAAAPQPDSQSDLQGESAKANSSASPGATLAPGIIGQAKHRRGTGHRYRWRIVRAARHSPPLRRPPARAFFMGKPESGRVWLSDAALWPDIPGSDRVDGAERSRLPGAGFQLGTDTLQHSAAARGSVLTGGTAKALDTYAQDYASNEYGKCL